MDYNDNREWDRGKIPDTPWYPPDSRQSYHPREDDHNAQGKRRKFNDGGYQGYDGPQAHEDYKYDANYTRQGPGFPQDQSGRGGGPGHPKKRLQPSEPSPHVIFLGLDPDFTESDLQSYLNSRGCSVETVTIIRERSTGSSKGFGFAQFSSSEHARAFVDPLFPFVQVPPPASHGATATAAFYKSLETGLPHNGRRVKIDYSQSATPHEKGRSRGNTNDGTRDIGNVQAPVLLFRGLDPLSGPQAIHQAMRNSSGVGKEGAQGMKRIILIKDKVTMASFGFAFVEFIDTLSASAVLAATMSPQIHPAGFRISDRPVAPSFAHPDSFQPIQEIMLRDEACLVSSLALGGVEGTYVRYWDESSMVAVLEFQVATPQSSTMPNAKDKKEKKKKDSAARPTAPPIPSALPVSDKPVTLSFNKGPFKTSISLSPAVKPLSLGFSADDLEENDDKEDNSGIGIKVNNSKGVASHMASKKTINNINKWNQVQEELSSSTKTNSPTLVAPTETPTVTSANASAPAGPPLAEDAFEFADMNSFACLLCSRQFKSVDQLKRHNKESDLHKARSLIHSSLVVIKNYEDVDLRDLARQKVSARQQAKVSEQPKYRDRALERRSLFNQPDVPVPDVEAIKLSKRKQVEGPPPPPPPPPQPLNPGQDGNNVGNKLLRMMGWKEGTGLGVHGEGRVDPMYDNVFYLLLMTDFLLSKTAIYTEGVGLGASKGKEVGKFTDASSGYLSMAQESVSGTASISDNVENTHGMNTE
ncbi:hypothetical protein C8R41DRAFT_976616 [Lentinula lateritia]|uniref:RNA-binding protein n=1 Tax=Lentinula lateritia TaxID=40482 RepID=A0ABQ8VZ59_9AGAR|nr:hypothetical protein C8R41DRAFT_976616 [Lentinula lateritia]